MALIKIPKEMGSTPGIVDNSNATAITIGSDESVTVTGGDISFYDDSDNAKFFWDASAESLGIGDLPVSSTPLSIRSDSGSKAITIYEPVGSNENWSIGVDVDGDLGFYNSADTTATVTFDDSGNVGIGGTPTAPLHVFGGGTGQTFQFIDTSEDTALFASSGNTSGKNTELVLRARSSNSWVTSGLRTNTGSLDFYAGEATGATLSGGTKRMTIDSSGNVLVGKTAPTISTTGVELRPDGQVFATKSGNYPLLLNRTTSDGDIAQFRKDGTVVGRIGVENGDNFYIGATAAGHGGLYFGSQNMSPMAAGVRADATMDVGAASYRFKNVYLSGFVRAGAGTAADPVLTGSDGNTGLFFPSGGVTCFTQNGVERGRFDASGNFLVGRTSVGGTGNGHSIRGGDSAIFSRDSTGESCIIARNNTPGPALRFNSNGANIGGIGTHSTGGVELYMGNGSNIGFRFEQTGADRIEPCVGLGQSGRNNAIDLGINGNRWRTVFCTTVNESSDRTLKQDIEALSDAEQRVAVAAKSLLRKYRFISDVEQEDNRYSFGIIAQDLQAAFAAEGLDAANYKMWNESTFTDETTGEEKTQQSIVYSQLLAFIISAI